MGSWKWTQPGIGTWKVISDLTSYGYQIEAELDVFVSTLPPADDLTMLAVRRLN